MPHTGEDFSVWSGVRSSWRPLLMAASNASLAEIGRVDRTDDAAVDVTDIDPRRTKEGRFLLLIW